VHAVKIKPLIEHYITKRSAIAENVCHASVQSSVMQYCDGAVWFIGYHLEHKQEKPKRLTKGYFSVVQEICSRTVRQKNTSTDRHAHHNTPLPYTE